MALAPHLGVPGHEVAAVGLDVRVEHELVGEPSARLANPLSCGLGRLLRSLKTLDDPTLCCNGLSPQTLLLWSKTLELVL